MEFSMSKAQKPRVVSLADLAQLTLRGNVAFAVRCAKRLRPFFSLPEGAPHRTEQIAAVDGAIRIAAGFCMGVTLEPGRALAAVKLAIPVADATYEDTRCAAFAAIRAAEAVVNAEEYLRNPKDDSLLIETVAAAFGAGRVLAANTDMFAQDLVVATLVEDADKLMELSRGAAQQIGAAIDLGPSGPLGILWPLGVPFGFRAE
jgi:hypothetical protein